MKYIVIEQMYMLCIRKFKFLYNDLNSLNSNFTKYTFGTEVTLTENVNYITPSDGYFTITSGANTAYYANAFINDVFVFAAVGNSVSNSIYVKKGMKIFFNSYGGATGKFVPIK